MLGNRKETEHDNENPHVSSFLIRQNKATSFSSKPFRGRPSKTSGEMGRCGGQRGWRVVMMIPTKRRSYHQVGDLEDELSRVEHIRLLYKAARSPAHERTKNRRDRGIRESRLTCCAIRILVSPSMMWVAPERQNKPMLILACLGSPQSSCLPVPRPKRRRECRRIEWYKSSRESMDLINALLTDHLIWALSQLPCHAKQTHKTLRGYSNMLSICGAQPNDVEHLFHSV